MASYSFHVSYLKQRHAEFTFLVRFAITWFTQVSGKGMHVHVSSERVSMYYKKKKITGFMKRRPCFTMPILIFCRSLLFIFLYNPIKKTMVLRK